MAEPDGTPGPSSTSARGFAYRREHALHCITLDSDTQLPPGRLRELVGVAAHPHNQPQIDERRRTVTGGYGVLQPRIVTPLPAPRDFTLYHWLFAGQCGIDPYSAASSEVYQDVFGEGSFTGKGLLNVQALHARHVLSSPPARGPGAQPRPARQARWRGCAAVTDITVIEEAPFHADVAASRVHRWTRGDWQLLPFLLQPRRYALRAINRWKMFDNLRRSLVAPMSLALMVLALGSGVVTLLSALALVLAAAFCGGPLMGAVVRPCAGAATTWPSATSTARRRSISCARCAPACGTWRNCCSTR